MERYSSRSSPAIKITLQELPSSTPVVELLTTSRIRATLRRRPWGAVIDRHIGHSKIDIVSGNGSIDRLWWIRASDER
jgi:hypothetical protein